MGLLDEAIKEHLELKRRHGADPSEVARLEHEALGPARREPVAEAPVVDEPIADVDEDEVAAVEEPVATREPPPVDDDHDFDEVPADERLDAPVRRVEPDPEPQEPHADVVPADEEPDSDDVLEETPEFLQETPEHDRLWFEQKPPRDFDF